VNFLRDLREDSVELGRAYLPATRREPLTDEQKSLILEDIRADLLTARAVIPLLPRSVQPAVRLAHDLFAELADVLEATASTTIARTRVRVPPRRKVALAATAVRRRGLPAMVQR
jgi:phytoene/squalene synthetase